MAADCIVGQMLSFINSQTGWIANENILLSTNNGGQNWNKIEIPAPIKALSLLSENEGYILSDNNILYFTKMAVNLG